MGDLNAILVEVDALKTRLDALRPLDNASVAEALAVETPMKAIASRATRLPCGKPI